MTASPGNTDAMTSTRPGLRRGHLGAGRIAFFVVAAVAPLAGVAGAAPVVFASNGAAAPATFLLAGALFALFSVGYVAMSRCTSNAGGFVAYVARGLGATPATAIAYVTVLTYLSVEVALWSQFGVFTQGLATGFFGLELPPWCWTLGLLAMGTLVVSRGVEASLWVAGSLLALEVGVLAIFDAAVLFTGDVGTAVTEGFSPTAVFTPGLGIAFLFGVAAFVGFEATVVFSEEARDPHRTVPRAIVISIGAIAGMYTITTVALATAWGPGNVQEAASSDPVSFLLTPASEVAGPWLADTFNVLIVTSFFAALVGFHNMFARLLFSLGRAGVLPSALGVTTGVRGTPRRAAVTIALTVALFYGAFTVAGADPITVTFSWLLALGTVGLLTILLSTSAAIIVFFWRDDREEGYWRSKVCPILAFIGFSVTGCLAIVNYDTLLGGSGGIARWLLILLPLVMAVGVVVGKRRSISANFSADLG